LVVKKGEKTSSLWLLGIPGPSGEDNGKEIEALIKNVVALGAHRGAIMKKSDGRD
jgi:hypothetical protein